MAASRASWACDRSFSLQLAMPATLMARMTSAVDGGPRPGVVPCALVVVDVLRRQHADDAVVHHDEADGDEEGPPVLVEHDHAHHHEEVEMGLDHAAGEVDQDRRGGHQADGGEDRALSRPPSPLRRAASAGAATKPASRTAWYQPVSAGQGEDEQAGTCSQSRRRMPRWRLRQTSSGSVPPRGRKARILAATGRSTCVVVTVAEFPTVAIPTASAVARGPLMMPSRLWPTRVHHRISRATPR